MDLILVSIAALAFRRRRFGAAQSRKPCSTQALDTIEELKRKKKKKNHRKPVWVRADVM